MKTGLSKYSVTNWHGSGEYFSPLGKGSGWGDGIDHTRTDGSGGGSGCSQFLHGGGAHSELHQEKNSVLLEIWKDTYPRVVILV